MSDDNRLTDRQLGMAIRQSLLMLLDALERWLGIEPRTSEIRKEHKRSN